MIEIGTDRHGMSNLIWALQVCCNRLLLTASPSFMVDSEPKDQDFPVRTFNGIYAAYKKTSIGI